MQLLLGLFFFSILLTTGSSLQCVSCLAINGYCSDVKVECPNGTDACLSLNLKSKDNKVQIIAKNCASKDICKTYEDKIDKVLSEFPQCEPCILREATCSKAPPSFASFFPAFLGLLLMKLLF